MGLRLKILSGFLILTLMLLLAGIWSIRQMHSIGASVQRILDENYETIDDAKVMTESVERQDSGILLLLLGKREDGRAILEEADRTFEERLERAQGNVSVRGEGELLADVSDAYGRYKKLWIRPIAGTEREGDLDWYSERVHPPFLEVKSALEGLMSLHDREMYRTASELKDEASRAVMPGVVAILAALVFSLGFSYLVNYYMVNPLIRITQGVNDFAEDQRPFDVKVETRDELGRLASAVQGLCARVRSFESKR